MHVCQQRHLRDVVGAFNHAAGDHEAPGLPRRQGVPAGRGPLVHARRCDHAPLRDGESLGAFNPDGVRHRCGLSHVGLRGLSRDVPHLHLRLGHLAPGLWKPSADGDRRSKQHPGGLAAGALLLHWLLPALHRGLRRGGLPGALGRLQRQPGPPPHGPVLRLGLPGQGRLRRHALGRAHDPLRRERHVLRAEGVRPGPEPVPHAHPRAGLRDLADAGAHEDLRGVPLGRVHREPDGLCDTRDPDHSRAGCPALQPHPHRPLGDAGDPLWRPGAPRLHGPHPHV
mmetsp:Transcript_76602/g.247935  ORF Transcript_76602/g.247935 Transcript_76602/m.247935 type:complete len:283 (+) Transcript_76602:1017-1865(+)